MSARDLQKSIRALVQPDPGYAPLDPAPEVGPQPGGVAVGQAGGTAGFAGASTFVEADYDQREYWAAITRTTSDGLFSWEELPIKAILLESGEKALFAEPT